MPFLFRFRYEVHGGHTHIRVFAGVGYSALGKCGDLVMRNEEFAAFVAGLERKPGGGSIEVLQELERKI